MAYRELRNASRDEVVCYFLVGEFSKLIEGCHRGERVPTEVIGGPPSRDEQALRSLTRVVARQVCNHSWAYDVLWKTALTWRVVSVPASEVTVMPVGGTSEKWHYPRLDEFVKSILEDKPHPEIRNPCTFVDTTRYIPFPRPILTVHQEGRYAIVDGAHRAAAQVAAGVRELEAYWGKP